MSNQSRSRKIASIGETVSQSFCRKTVRVGWHRWLQLVARPDALRQQSSHGAPSRKARCSR